MKLPFLGHETQKAFGWFGGMGFERSLEFFQAIMGIPAPLTVFVIFTELFRFAQPHRRISACWLRWWWRPLPTIRIQGFL
jgi:hypothetical protein